MESSIVASAGVRGRQRGQIGRGETAPSRRGGKSLVVEVVESDRDRMMKEDTFVAAVGMSA